MMCDECGIRPANFHLTTITNGEKTERNLCPVCIAKYQKKIPGFDFSNLAGILSGLIEKKQGAKAEQADPETLAITCTQCGATYRDFQTSGKLGCAQCYKAFSKPLENLLGKMQGSSQHVGRIPDSVAGETSIRLNIDRLRMQLGKAVEEEEYEEAAQLRDRIRALSKKLEERAVASEGGSEHE